MKIVWKHFSYETNFFIDLYTDKTETIYFYVKLTVYNILKCTIKKIKNFKVKNFNIIKKFLLIFRFIDTSFNY